MIVETDSLEVVGTGTGSWTSGVQQDVRGIIRQTMKATGADQVLVFDVKKSETAKVVLRIGVVAKTAGVLPEFFLDAARIALGNAWYVGSGGTSSPKQAGSFYIEDFWPGPRQYVLDFTNLAAVDVGVHMLFFHGRNTARGSNNVD